MKDMNNPFYGKHHTEETKQRMSLTRQGQNNPRYGKQVSSQTRAKISFARKGQQLSAEHRLKLSLAHKGRKFSDEHKNKIARAAKMRWQISGFAEKISEAMRMHWRDPNFRARVINGRRKANCVKPNKAERQLQDILNKHFPNTYKYVGDLQVSIGGRCPDFINVDGKKEVIELFGCFYHRPDEVEPLIARYRENGFCCFVIWDTELKDEEALVNHIRNGNILMPYSSSTIFDYRQSPPAKRPR